MATPIGTDQRVGAPYLPTLTPLLSSMKTNVLNNATDVLKYCVKVWETCGDLSQDTDYFNLGVKTLTYSTPISLDALEFDEDDTYRKHPNPVDEKTLVVSKRRFNPEVPALVIPKLQYFLQPAIADSIQSVSGKFKIERINTSPALSNGKFSSVSYTLYAYNSYRWMRSIISGKHATYGKINLSNSGHIEMVPKEGSATTEKYYLGSEYPFQSGTTELNLTDPFFISSNGLFLLHHKNVNNGQAGSTFTIYLNTYNTGNLYSSFTSAITSRSSEGVSLYKSYCNLLRNPTTDESKKYNNWVDPRCGCIMLDDNMKTQFGSTYETTINSTTTKNNLLNLIPCFTMSCLNNVNKTGINSLADAFYNVTKCPTDIKICNLNLTNANGASMGNLNVNACNNQSASQCTKDSDCNSGQGCRDGICKNKCSIKSDCGDNEICSNSICIPMSTIPTPSSSGNGQTGVNTSGGSSSDTANGTSSMTMYIIIGVVALLLIGGGVWYFRSRKSSPSKTSHSAHQPTSDTTNS